MRRLLLVLGLAFSALFLFLALRGLQLDEFWRTLQQANLIWLAPAIIVYFLSVVVRSWRWSYMLRPLKAVSTRRLYPVVVIGYMGNNIFPARIGEIVRAMLLQSKEGIPIASSLATVFMERLIDGIVMVGFVLVALVSVPALPTNLRTLVQGSSAIFAVGAAVFFALALVPATAERLAGALAARFLPDRLQGPLLGFVSKFVAGAGSLRSPIDLGLIVLSTVITWLLETVKYWLIWQSFSANKNFMPLPFVDLMLFNGVANLSTIIPSGPGFVGTYEAAGVGILTAVGVERSLATAYTLVMHIALWLPVTLLGLIFMLREGLRLSDLRGAGGEVRSQTSDVR